MSKVMPKVFVLLVILFIAGWVLRVGMPYQKTRSHTSDDLNREGTINVLLDKLYAAAATNGGRFPSSLAVFGPIQDPAGRTVDLSKYLLNTNATAAEKMNGERIVIAEDPERFRPGLYYAGAEGRVVVSWSNPKYRELLSKNGLTQ